MQAGLYNILYVLGALAFFIYGMKLMSDGVQRAAGSQLRNILQSMTKNRFLGVLTGFLTTSLVQSSSATTVMTVSFVSAGLLTLTESAGVMMGANIGTTVTSWIIAGLQTIFESDASFELSLATLSVPIFVFGVPMLFSNRGKTKYWGEFLIGFAILFMGLNFLQESVPDLSSNPETLDFLKRFTDYGVFSRILFVLIGALITVLVQSSSAAIAITMTLCIKGWIPFEMAAAMVLGENIGTTLTAEIAALVGNTNARRSARIHSLFNLIGVSWMVILLPFFIPLLSKFVGFDLNDTAHLQDQVGASFGISAFHTFFNLLNVILMIGFVKLLVKLATKTVAQLDEEEEQDAKLKFLGSIKRTPEFALIELQKETAHFGEITSRMSGFTKSLINEIETKKQKKLFKQIKKYEKITDNLEVEITNYVTSLSSQELTNETSTNLRSILNICNELERIADVYFQISLTVQQKIEQRAYFTPDQRNNINEMIDKVHQAFMLLVHHLNEPYHKVDLTKAKAYENDINKLRDKLREHNLDRIGDDDYNTQSAFIYNNIFTALEKIGNHVYNINEAIAGKI